MHALRGNNAPLPPALAGGLTTVLVAVTGQQNYNGSPTFTPSATLPSGLTLTGGLTCTTVGSSITISRSLAVGSHTLLASSCGGLSLSGTNASNYTLAYTSASNDFTVHQAPVTVAVSGSQTYGGSPTFSGTATPPSGVTVTTTGLTCATVGTSTAIAPTLAVANGPYTLVGSSCSGATLSGSNAPNYAIAYTSAANDFTVSPAPLLITAASGTMTYGGAVPSVTAAYSGFVNGQTNSVLSAQPTCSTLASSLSPVSGSPFATSCGGAVGSNYSISYAGGTIAINPAPLTITASSPTMQYGATVPQITPSYEGFVNGDTTSDLSPQPTCSTTATSTSTVAGSPYPSSCGGASDPDYAISYVSGSVSVTTATVNVAVSGSQTYGGSPSFRGTDTAPSGVTVDTSGLKCTTVGSSTTIAPDLPVATGPYKLLGSSCSGATLNGTDSTSYTINYTSVGNDFAVNPAPLTVTASNRSMVSGGTVPTITASYSGFVNGQNASFFTSPPTCITTVTSSSPPSPPTYPATCGGALDPNYAFTYVSGSVTVTQAATLDVAVSGSQTYGGSPSFRGTDKAPAGITVDTSGLKCTTVGSSTTIAPNLPVATGPYTLLGSSCSGATLSGTDAATYAIAYTSAPNDFTVTPAVLTVTASSGTMTYGSPVPSITAAYTGFVNGQTSSALTSRPSCSTTVTSSSPVSGSPYVTSCGDAVDPNYAFTYDGGSVKVNQAQLTITASSGTMTYGGTVPTITAGYSGFVNGETPLNLTTLPICATTATNSSSSSSSAYPTSCTGAADSNYGITYVAGSVSVASAPLDVAVSGSQTYGGQPSFSGTDTAPSGVTVTTTDLNCTTIRASTTIVPSLAVAGGPYTLLASSCSGATLSGANAADYSIAYTSAASDFTVSAAPLQITASSTNVIYGTVPTITPMATGFLNGDTDSSLTTQPTCSTTVTSSSPVSPPTYPSSCRGASDPNYTISYIAGSITVLPDPVDVAVSGSQTYGGSPRFQSDPGTPPSGISVTGRVTCTMVDVTTAITPTLNTGSHTLATSSCSGASIDGTNASDYMVVYTAAPNDFTLHAAPLDVAVSGSQTYGGSPSFSGTDTAPSGVTVTTTDLNCTTIGASTTIAPSLAVAGGPYTLRASSCSGATLSGANAADYSIDYTSAASDFTVSAAPLQITASSTNVIYGTVPTITPMATGFLNGDSLSSLTTQPTCSTTMTSSSPVSPPTYPSSCRGAFDPNYTISYIAGSITVLPDPGHRGHRF